MTIISQAQTIDTVAGLIGSLTNHSKPIKFTKDNYAEMVTLVIGGVKFTDFQYAANVWIASKVITNDWQYICRIALVRCAQALARSWED